MKKGLLLAVLMIFTALTPGCAMGDVLPSFLLPAVLDPGPPAAATPDAAPTAMPRATQTPLPTATPVPTATPEPVPAPYDTLAVCKSAVPQGLTVRLAYDRYETPLDYFVALKSGNIRARATADSQKLLSIPAGSRYIVNKMVLGEDGESHWYQVHWSDKTGSHEGYVSDTVGVARSFRLDRMLEQAVELKAAVDRPATVYVTNYKNSKGTPPLLPGGKDLDAWGNRRSQSAPAYEEPDAASAFRYAPDGLLGQVMATSDKFTQVYFPSFGEARWVPTKYLSKQEDAIETLRQVVVVDRLYQNAAVLEYGDDGWNLIAMTYVSTGRSGQYALPTPLGYFMAQGKVAKFYYYADGTQFIEGYAPWAIRFSAGGYLHGVPRKCEYDASGNRTDPPAAEALRNLGTTPQSHMCVRNFTSFAKFLYDWFEKGSCSVIVME